MHCFSPSSCCATLLSCVVNRRCPHPCPVHCLLPLHCAPPPCCRHRRSRHQSAAAIALLRYGHADTKKLFESAVHDPLPSSVVNRRYEAWQEALALVRSFEETRSRHQAILSLERDTVACKHLCQVHLRPYVVAMLNALFDTIHQCTATCANTLVATGIDVAIHRICVERDFCAASLDAILTKIAHIVVIHNSLTRPMSPACSPRSSS